MDKEKYFKDGVTLFNEGKFYESHEEIEVIWLKSEGEEKLFLQALIITAGGFCHIKKSRFYPAYKALSKAILKFSQCQKTFFGLDINQLKVSLIEWVQFLEENNCHTIKDQLIEESRFPEFPKIVF